MEKAEVLKIPGIRLILAGVVAISLLYALLGVCGQTNWPPIRTDGEGYYAYLPSLVIHGNFDLETLRPYHQGRLPAGSWKVEETSRYHIKYPIGEAICQLPLFLAIHSLMVMIVPDQATGYSLPYQLGVTLAGTLYALAGLLFLFFWLRRRFPLPVVHWTLLFTAFGTSLAHYASYDAFASHIYTFAWLCILLDQLDRWSFSPGYKRALFIGAVFGLLFCIRNYSLAFGLLFLPALPLALRKISVSRLALQLGIMAATTLLIALPQFIFWKYSTGHWLSYSYGSEGFTWSESHFLDVLLSVRKGVLFYTPGLALGLAGLVWLIARGRERWLAAASLACILVVYILASFWSGWSFGGSFGHRAFVDVYPLFALGLAYLLERGLKSSRWTILRLLLTALVAFNLVQMSLYWAGYLKSDNNTWNEYGMAYYRPVLFLRDLQYDWRYPQNTSRMTKVEEMGEAFTLTPPPKHSLHSAESVPLRLHVENHGRWIWKEVGRYGGVKLSLRWVPVTPASPAPPEAHFEKLTAPLLPGRSVDFDLTLPAPVLPGSYQLAACWIISGLASTPEKTLLDITVVAP